MEFPDVEIWLRAWCSLCHCPFKPTVQPSHTPDSFRRTVRIHSPFSRHRLLLGIGAKGASQSCTWPALELRLGRSQYIIVTSVRAGPRPTCRPAILNPLSANASVQDMMDEEDMYDRGVSAIASEADRMRRQYRRMAPGT